MGRMIGTIAGIAALGLLGASPSQADVPEPKPGKWEGRLTQIFELGGEPFDFGLNLDFTVKRVQRPRASKPTFKIVNFDTNVLFGRPFAPDTCGPGGYRILFSAPSRQDGRRYRFAHTDSEQTVYPNGRVEYFEAVDGKFTGKTKAKGGLVVDYYDSVHYEEPQDCTSGSVRWTARRVVSATGSG